MLIWSFWFCFIIEEFKSFVFLHKFFLGELQNIFPVSDLSNSFFLNKILWKGEFTALTEYLVTVFMTFKSFNFYKFKYNQLKPIKELSFGISVTTICRALGCKYFPKYLLWTLQSITFYLQILTTFLSSFVHYIFWDELRFYDTDIQTSQNVYTNNSISLYYKHTCNKI